MPGSTDRLKFDDGFSDSSSQKRVDVKIEKHLNHQEVKNELQDILGNMMREDVSTIEVLQHNAKAFGGVIGAEEDFAKGRIEFEENEFFQELPSLQLQDLSFS